MKKLIALMLFSLLTLPACITDEMAYEDIEGIEAQLDNRPLELDTSCHVDASPGQGAITNGTKDSFFRCCGDWLCDDRDMCSEDEYGTYVTYCVDCHYFECLPGPSAEPGDDGTGWPPVIDPPGGGVYDPSDDGDDDGGVYDPSGGVYEEP